MMSSKFATPGLLKIKLFWNEGYDVIMSVHAVTKKIILCGSNYIVVVVCDQTMVALAFLWE